MELNPILRRDLRARWRNWRAFGLIFVYAALLAGIMGWQYANLIDGYDPISSDRRHHLAYVSLTLFRSLNVMQIFGWMLIAPALTASAIAGEREKDLLESLQLSRLSATRIVGGKLWCALGFLILMLLIPLPVMAVCFTLGGISPGDFISAAALQISTAITCACIGLAVSAWSRRVNAALGKAFVYVLAWGLGLTFLNNFGGSSFRLLRSLNPLYVAQYIGGGSNYIYVPSPSLATAPLSPSMAARIRILYATLNASYAAAHAVAWKICIAFELALCLILLWTAIRGTRKAFDPPQWVARKLWVDYLKRLIPQPDMTPSAPPAQQWQERARYALWWEFPLASWLRFSNPILQRETRNKLRLRGTSWKSGLVKLVLGGIAAYFYFNWFAVEQYRAAGLAYIGWQTIYFWMGATILVAAVLGASAIPRERETGTWEALGLSLLPKDKILSGKVVPPLLACLLYSIPLWPMIIVCTDFHTPQSAPYNSSTMYGSYYSAYGSNAYGYGGIYFVYILAALVIIAATAWGCTAIAMLISWRFQRAAVAVSWTLGFFLVVFIAVPLLLSEFDNALRTSTPAYGVDSGTVMLNFSGLGGGQLMFRSGTLQLWRYIHPLLALGLAVPSGHLSYMGQNSDPLDDCLYEAFFPALGLGIAWLIGGLAVLTLLRHLMRDHPRQKEAIPRAGWLYAKL